ncbi:transcription-repair coupling factor [Thermostilla marina]
MAVPRVDQSVTGAPLSRLCRSLTADHGLDRIVAGLRSGHAVTLDGVWGSACALAAAALVGEAAGPIVIVLPSAEHLDAFGDDWRCFSDRELAFFPPQESLPDDLSLQDPNAGERLRLLKRFLRKDVPAAVATCPEALLVPCPARQSLEAKTRTLRVGDRIEVTALTRFLAEAGYHATTAVELPGEFSVRGGIVDIFAVDWPNPVRIELFGDEIDSLREFEVATQRSVARLEQVDLTTFSPGAPSRGRLTDYLPTGTWTAFVELDDIRQTAKRFLERAVDFQQLWSWEDAAEGLIAFPSIAMWAIAPTDYETRGQLRIESVERFSGDIEKVRDELSEATAGCDVYLVCANRAEIERLQEVFASTTPAREGRLHYVEGRLHEGFRLIPESTVVISSGELFRRADVRRPVRRYAGRAIDSFVELSEGDLVVHVSHGIARYRGLRKLEKGDRLEEHLELEFAEGTRLFVPASRIDLVQKYIGGTKRRPRLSKLGGRMWQRQKSVVEKAVRDLAADMLELQAHRAIRPGIAFPPDTEWQREFDALFPFEETPDQLRAWDAIKADMQRPVPMDRLLCGDVGFGKTEIAMRAAFKAVDAGYQVAVLVPTTVLAEQHLRTFRDRMAEFPIEIASLSRFSTPREQRETIARLSAGAVDIVIGTHRLASADVQFHNLGLLIIDEEQRFGVEIKERLKALRKSVDVLTMTATPIPRTLHMALVGVRDISNLETPPEDRLAVETRVCRFDDDLIRHAVLRELQRDGQVYFVHNRIEDMPVLAARLQRIVPEASIRIAHAQLPEHELEQIMCDFVAHRFDVLLTTTIIESGLDIPNANTIFIDHAHRFGLADLHQLRGRVGRYKHRAYCYLLIDPNDMLSPNAARRLRAVEEFSHLGAGFSLAMRDLEIRGAGNILGTQQSGHIAAVGYELYCSLLENAVRSLQNLPPRTYAEVSVDLPCRAYLPDDYIPEIRLKIDLYRRLARTTAETELEEFLAELADRFGSPPKVVKRLVELQRLRIRAATWAILDVHTEDTFVVFQYASAERIRQLNRSRGNRLRIADRQSAYLPLDRLVDIDTMIAEIIDFLRPE